MRGKLPVKNRKDSLLIGRWPVRVKRLLRSPQSVKVVTALLLMAFLASLSLLRQLSTEYSIQQFYPKNHPLLLKDQEIRQTFRLNQKSPFLFVVTFDKGSDWLRPRAIADLKQLSQKIQERPDVATLLSLTQVEGATQTKTELLIGNIFERVPQTRWRTAILQNPLLFPLLVTSDFQSSLIVVEPAVSTTKELVQLHDDMRTLIQKQFPTGHVLSAGVPMIQTRLSQLIRSELGLFLVIAVLVFCALFYFLFSHWTAIVCAFITLTSCNLLALSLLAGFGIPMNIVLVTLPIITSVTVMSLLIHTLHLWSQKPLSQTGTWKTRWPGALRTCRELCLANFLGAWTTALGFLALVPSPIPMIRQYGWVVAVIVGLVSVFGQLLLLVSLPFVRPAMRKWFDRPAFWSLLPLRFSKTIFALLVISVIGGALLAPRLNFSGRLFDDLPENDGVRASTEWIDQVYGGVVSFELVLNSTQENFWKSPQHLKRLSQLAKHLRRHPSIGSVVTASDFFQNGVPNKAATIAETFFLFSMAERNPMSNYLTEDAKRLRLMIRLKDEPNKQITATKLWIESSVGALFPELSILEGGAASSAHAINQEVSKELVFGFWQSLLLIGLFLGLMFRSLRWALIACLPNCIPPALLMGALAISGVPLKPGIALIFSIALGFAFNNTVYLLSRLRSLMRTGKFPLRRALLMEANPCFFESFVMFAGFSIFLLSHFAMNRYFGAFMMISIAAGFLADLYFLPALLRLFPGVLQSQPRQQQLAERVSPPSRDKDISRVAASVALFVFFSMSPLKAQAQTAPEILQKSRSQLEAHDDQALIEMKILEKNGEQKIRVIDLKTLRGPGFFKVLAKIQSPADIKGMGFLGEVRGGIESQWIYLPSSGQVRRVVAGKTSGGLLGSELSAEDLNSEAVRSASVKIEKSDSDSWSVAIRPPAGTSVYSRVVSRISKKDFLPRQTDYYVQERIKKSVEFKEYKKIGAVWRAQLLVVQNRFNGRGTEVRISEMKLNSGLKEKDFSQSALKDD